MIKKAINKVQLLTIAIVVYMLAALGWWSVLLLRMNSQIHECAISQDNVADLSTLQEAFARQKNMIIGEGLFFALALIIGIYLLYRSYRKEVMFTKRQNNFLLSVTHEFKTPLSVLKLINQTLENPKLGEDKKSALLSNNADEINRLESLVNNLLASTRIDHEYEANFEKVDLGNFLDQLLRSNHARWPQEIKTQLASGMYGSIDRELFTIVLQNLLDNASKYSPHNRAIHLGLQSVADNIQITVRDEGIGMDIKDQRHIFEKFYRSGNEETRKSKGTGLGLYLVKEILKLHRADISVESKMDKGSLFKITMPQYEE